MRLESASGILLLRAGQGAGIPRAVCASILGADADIIDSYYVHIGEEAQEKAIRTLSAASPQTAEARISAALQLLSTIPDKTDLLSGE